MTKSATCPLTKISIYLQKAVNSRKLKNKMKKAEKKQFDVCIIGGGPGGLSAALWCAELGLSAVLLEKEKEFGGQLLRTYNAIENHLGATTRNGREMRDIFLRQTENRNFLKRLQTEIISADLPQKIVRTASGEEISARCLIIATGVRRRKLNIPGEDFFCGKGIIESGKKDAGKIVNKTVVIVGGGDAALENAIILSEKAKRVFLIHRREKFRGREEFLEKIRQNDKVGMLLNTELLEISGSNAVESVKVKNPKTGEIKTLPVEAVLLRIGIEPNTEIFRGQIELDKDGYIETNSLCETSVKGVFAVGDVANPISPTISTAVGMGATAAKEIFSFLGK